MTFKINGYFVLVARRCCLLKHGVRSVPTDPIRMLTTEGSAEEGQPSGSREDRITQLTVESDHKPLEVIVKKPLHLAPKRLQRMLLRVQAHSINLGYSKGSTMYLADALSRAYLLYDGSQTIASEVESINMTQDACLKPSTLQEIKQHAAKGDSLQELIKVIRAGWPETKGKRSHLVLPYFGIRDELSVDDDVHGCQGREISDPKIATSRSDTATSLCAFRCCQHSVESKRMHLLAGHE